jgi:predicted AAA+ superfamily ATPase
MMKHRNYKLRLIDKILQERLTSAGAVLLRGAKGCGKTFTAEQVSNSEIFIDTDPQVANIMNVDPSLLLRGATPRLLDEWQIYPEVWNYVRREVDNRQAKGQFILTGSANPAMDSKVHSGVGRFSVLKMRTMSRAELSLSNTQVSLSKLLVPGAEIKFGDVEERLYSIDEVIRQLIFGGWPELLNAGLDEAIRFSRDYVALTSEVDISRADGIKRDPAKVSRLIQSYARNIATQAAITSITKDVKGDDDEFTETTAYSYIEALEKLMFIDNLPAWNTHVRSTAALRTTTKRHFSDPSLAVGALKLSVDDLLKDLNYVGFLFESSVIHDLRVYADTIDAEVSFFRDAKDREVDAIVQKGDGSWAGFEIKLGEGRINEGAEALINLLTILDFDKVPKPSSLNVITSSGFPYKRPDGVNVIPASVLTV